MGWAVAYAVLAVVFGCQLLSYGVTGLVQS